MKTVKVRKHKRKIKQTDKLKKEIMNRLWLKRWSVRAERLLKFVKKHKLKNLKNISLYETTDTHFPFRRGRKFDDYTILGANKYGNSYTTVFAFLNLKK